MSRAEVMEDLKPSALPKSPDTQNTCQRNGTISRRGEAIKPYRWPKGVSGNPRGGPVGRRFKSQVGDFLSRARDDFELYMTPARLNKFFGYLMEHARKGNPIAIQTIAERTMPVRKVPISIDARSVTYNVGGLLDTLAALPADALAEMRANSINSAHESSASAKNGG